MIEKPPFYKGYLPWTTYAIDGVCSRCWRKEAGIIHRWDKSDIKSPLFVNWITNERNQTYHSYQKEIPLEGISYD